MQRIQSTTLPESVGQRVSIAGFVHRRRLLKSVAFLIVRDPAGLAQVVVTDPAVREQVAGLTEETAVRVTGEVAASSAAPAGAELVALDVRVLGEVAQPPPFDLYRPGLQASLPVQLDHAPLSLRHPRRRAGLRVAAAAVAGFRQILTGLGFTEVFTPKVVASATESGANVFPVDWFGSPAFLAQSPQFYKQMLVGALERVFEVGPVFRAEPHDTARHLAQYTSLDVELGFIESDRDVRAVLREALAGMLAAVVGQAGADLELWSGSVPEVPESIPELDFPQALVVAGADPAAVDLSPAGERAVGRWAQREHGSAFVFVTGYPLSKRPFYTFPDPDRPGYSYSFDLLFRGVELVTGGQRQHRYDEYVAALSRAGEPLEPYRSYLEVFRHGFPPHGGFAIGLERFAAQLLGAGNVREVTSFPRDLHRLTP